MGTRENGSTDVAVNIAYLLEHFVTFGVSPIEQPRAGWVLIAAPLRDAEGPLAQSISGGPMSGCREFVFGRLTAEAFALAVRSLADNVQVAVEGPVGARG